MQWEQTLEYTFTYPYELPPGPGGAPAVALDSHDNLWVFQRAEAGSPQLFKFDPNHNLILEVGPDVIGYQDKAHGMAVDAEDNLWITATNGATVMKLSPEGKLLLTIGESGRRGDWNEAEGQRLLWQPVMVAFAANGDVYIGQGHGNESPNDTDDPDRLARFEREAKVLASLNHPNIGHIYRLEEAEGQKALVLELVEGSTLAERIKHGPIPVDEALPIANCPAVAQDSMVEKGPRHRGAGRGDGPGGAPVAEVQRLCGPSRHRRRVPGPRAGSHRSGTSRLRQIPDRSTRESVRYGRVNPVTSYHRTRVLER